MHANQQSQWHIDAGQLRADLHYHLTYTLCRPPAQVTPQDVFEALALALRRPLVSALQETSARQRQQGSKRLAYLSLEFLLGRALENTLQSLHLLDVARDALREFNLPLEQIADCEHDAALGNGGLGRLAACFLDSLATLDYAATGYGIHYEFGLFRQEIANGQQREHPDQWFHGRSPWMIERSDLSVMVPAYGHIETAPDASGVEHPIWLGWRLIIGVPHDFPVVGHGGRTVNVLRLYSARASDDFDMAIFNEGDYLAAVEEKLRAETISKVLYPSDEVPQGRELRLLQEYFLVACAVRDIWRTIKEEGGTAHSLGKRVAIQLNDTHPALTVAELMRLLVDEERLPWDEAFDVTRATLAYTNHTLMSEALEKWPVSLLQKLLPRHLQIIYDINHHFLEAVRQRWPGDVGKLQRLSLVEEGHERQIRMAHLAIVGSHSTNGVARLHTELIKSQLVPDFHALWPERFNNKTNGITQRRWLLKANPGLARLITEAIGPAWETDLSQLERLRPLGGDAEFRRRFAATKRANKVLLSQRIKELTGVAANPDSVFDVQVKRIHEYKRQLLNIMHVIHSYLRIVEDGITLAEPRTVIFAGKAAPGYYMAKRIIHLINAVARTVSSDPRVGGQLQVAFLPDYRVSLAELIIPAADVSEQISTAGMEASGTGNMKLGLNGAVTLGTLDGANVEILEQVGPENIVIFGLNVAEAQALRPRYVPRAVYEADAQIARVVDAISSGRFCPEAPEAFHSIANNLLQRDFYLHLADFNSYVAAHEQIAAAHADPRNWWSMAIANTARLGYFSSDRTIREYAEQIWHLEAAPVSGTAAKAGEPVAVPVPTRAPRKSTSARR